METMSEWPDHTLLWEWSDRTKYVSGRRPMCIVGPCAASFAKWNLGVCVCVCDWTVIARPKSLFPVWLSRPGEHCGPHWEHFQFPRWCFRCPAQVFFWTKVFLSPFKTLSFLHVCNHHAAFHFISPLLFLLPTSTQWKKLPQSFIIISCDGQLK